MNTKRTPNTDLFRREKIAKIKIAQKQLGLTDEDYRAILQRVAKVSSCADAGPSQLDEILRHMNRLGFKPKMRQGNTRQSKMIRAIWKEVSREKTEASLRGMIARVLNLDENVAAAPDFLSPADAQKVIQALKAMQARLVKEKIKGGNPDDGQS